MGTYGLIQTLRHRPNAFAFSMTRQTPHLYSLLRSKALTPRQAHKPQIKREELVFEKLILLIKACTHGLKNVCLSVIYIIYCALGLGRAQFVAFFKASSQTLGRHHVT
jgi:hypothetical protein